MNGSSYSVGTMNRLLETGCKNSPEKNAFFTRDTSISYHDLDEKSNQLANWLQDTGLTTGECVGILLPRSIYTPVAVYGVFKSGGVVVPVDTGLPDHKISVILKDCGIKRLITSHQFDRVASYMDNGLMYHLADETGTDWDSEFSSQSTHIREQVYPKSSDPAYIMYTSGSTGKPKGIVHTHDSGLAYAKQSVELYGVGSEDIIGNVAALHFDQSTFGYFSSVFAGASTYIYSDAELIMPASFVHTTKENRITILYTVPSLYLSLLKSGVKLDLPDLRWIKYGGELFPPKQLNRLIQALPQVTISNVYGPAEVNQCTYKNIRERVTEKLPVPIGRVWPNTKYLIVDDEDQEVSKGEKGELLIHSLTMMKGYWKNKTLTEQVFFIKPEPLGETKYYRTGDMVYENKEGDIVFVERKDRQVKIRGKRVEISEVELVMIQVGDVQDVAVFTIEEDHQKELCAAVVRDPKSTSGLDVMMLRKGLRKKLETHAIPKYIFEISDMPLTINGKVYYEQLSKDFAENIGEQTIS